MNGDPLANLKDIHLPPPPSIWPLAIGWWLVIGAIVICIIIIIGIGVYRYKTRTKRAALAELKQFNQKFAKSSDYRLLAKETSIFLRRLALSISAKNGAVCGENWLELLDSLSPAQPFSTNYREIISEYPYKKECPPFDYSPLLTDIRGIIRRQL